MLVVLLVAGSSIGMPVSTLLRRRAAGSHSAAGY